AVRVSPLECTCRPATPLARFGPARRRDRDLPMRSSVSSHTLLYRVSDLVGYGQDMAAAKQIETPGSSTKPAVLVVEDVVLVRLLLADFLRGRDFHVIEV